MGSLFLSPLVPITIGREDVVRSCHSNEITTSEVCYNPKSSRLSDEDKPEGDFLTLQSPIFSITAKFSIGCLR